MGFGATGRFCWLSASAFLVEAGAHLPLEGLQSRPVQDFHRRTLQIVAETVVVVIHPCEQELGRLSAIRASRLPRRDPAAEQAAGERPEFAIRVVDLLCLQVAAGDEGFIQGDGAHRVGDRQFRNFAFTVTKVRNKGEAFVPANEASRLESGLNQALHRVAALSRLGHCCTLPYIVPTHVN